MQDQLNDLNSDMYCMLQDDGHLLPSCAQLPEAFLKKTKRLTLEIPVNCHQLCKTVASGLGITMGDLVYHVVRRYIFELAADNEAIKVIRDELIKNALMEDLPAEVLTYEQKEEYLNATTHKLPWE